MAPLSIMKKFPTIVGIRWFNLAVFSITPLLAVYGLLTIRLKRDTALFSVAYYIFSMLGERNTYFVVSRME